jgi:hypothetical protein
MNQADRTVFSLPAGPILDIVRRLQTMECVVPPDRAARVFDAVHLAMDGAELRFKKECGDVARAAKPISASVPSS